MIRCAIFKRRLKSRKRANTSRVSDRSWG